LPVLDAVWHLGGEQAGELLMAGGSSASHRSDYAVSEPSDDVAHGLHTHSDASSSSALAATRSHSPLAPSSTRSAGSHSAKSKLSMHNSTGSLRANSSSPRPSSLASSTSNNAAAAAASSTRPALGHNTSAGNVRTTQSLLLLHEQQAASSRLSRSQPSSPRSAGSSETPSTIDASHVVWRPAPPAPFADAPFLAPLLAIADVLLYCVLH
jgi:hypothetical protein